MATPLKRGLYAILAADVAGYSRLMGEAEEDTVKILRAHRAVIDSIIELHDGRIFNTAGDSVLAAFASPVEAVRAAIEIQDALNTRNLSLPEARRLVFRIGINLGDVIQRGEDLLGDAVNIAARLESNATPGGICISGSVYDQIQGKLDLRFEPQGEVELKNIVRPVRAYHWSTQHETVPAFTPAKRRIATPRSTWIVLAAGAAASIAGLGLYLFRDTIWPLSAPVADSPALQATAPAGPFDGIWNGRYCPQTVRDLEAYCVNRVIQIRNSWVKAEWGQEGQPGYTRFQGPIAPDGSVKLAGNGLAGQGRARGNPFTFEVAGRVDDDKLMVTGKFASGRELVMEFTRQR